MVVGGNKQPEVQSLLRPGSELTAYYFHLFLLAKVVTKDNADSRGGGVLATSGQSELQITFHNPQQTSR